MKDTILQRQKSMRRCGMLRNTGLDWCLRTRPGFLAGRIHPLLHILTVERANARRMMLITMYV